MKDQEVRSASREVRDRAVTRVFVTGAAGYIGRNVTRDLRRQGIEVVGLVRRRDQATMLERMGASSAIGDITVDDLAESMAGCDALVHAAADTDHGRGGSKQWQVNVTGTARVFAAARQVGISAAVHLSSESVLADGKPLVRATENQAYPRRAAGSYSWSKQEAERIALAADGRGMAVVILRPRMVWGRDDTTALPMLKHMAQAGKLAWIDGGRYLTTTTHIANLTHAVELALRRGRGGEIYFIGDAQPSPFRDFVTDVLATQGIAAPDKVVPRWLIRAMVGLDTGLSAISRGRLSGPVSKQVYAASAVENTLDIGKAQRELQYMPLVNKQDGMAELQSLAASSAAGSAADQ